MQFYGKFLFDSLRSDINCKSNLIADCFVEICSVIVEEKNPVPKSQTKPFYIGTKEAPSDIHITLTLSVSLETPFLSNLTSRRQITSS